MRCVTRCAIMCLAMLATILCTAGAAWAQPNLNLKRVIRNWPTIEVYLTAACGGQPEYGLSKQNFRVVENGVEIKDFTLWCPDPTSRCPISVALVFDGSSTMQGAGNAGAKQAGHEFVGLMDGLNDEATVLWFSQNVNVAQSVTTIKPALDAAIDMLPAAGAKPCWDGVYAGVAELVSSGVNPCRAVIVMTEGTDNASTHSVSDVVSLATRNRIRVFTVGLGADVNTPDLENLARLTGGRYYRTPTAIDLAAVYQEISTIVYQGFQECLITYTSSCTDGTLRSVDLHLQDFCGGSDVMTRTFMAPLDTTTFTDLSMDLGDVGGKATSDITVPLMLTTPIVPEQLFHPLAFTLLYDQTCVQFASATAPPGALLEGIAIIATPVTGGTHLRVDDQRLLQGQGLLLNVTFHAGNPTDTTCCDVTVQDAAFDHGCFIPRIEPGQICVYPATVGVEDETRAAPATYRLQQNRPNPFKPSTTIDYALPVTDHVRITVTDALGREVAVLVDEMKPAGSYSTTFHARNLPSGVYFCRMHTPRFDRSVKMALAR